MDTTMVPLELRLLPLEDLRIITTRTKNPSTNKDIRVMGVVIVIDPTLAVDTTTTTITPRHTPRMSIHSKNPIIIILIIIIIQVATPTSRMI
jgi:hypothetical protein